MSNKPIYTSLAGFAEYERELIGERVRAGTLKAEVARQYGIDRKSIYAVLRL